MRTRTLLQFPTIFFLGGSFASILVHVKAQSGLYGYVIFSEETSCERSTVSMIGYAHGDDEYMVGAHNDLGLCGMESICLVDSSSEICQDTEDGIVAEVRYDIQEDGRIFQCDDSNTLVNQGVCRYLEGCYNSSVYPHCAFQVATTIDLLSNPDLILNENPHENDILNLQSYLLLYSDESCSEFEGAQGLVAGETTFYTTPESMSCVDAVSCAFFPDGEYCANRGGTTGEIQKIYTQPAASRAIVCSDETTEHCEEIDPNSCMKSEIFPSCSYRLTTAKSLFAEPSKYITGTRHINASQAPGEEALAPTASPTSCASKVVGSLELVLGMFVFYFSCW